MKKSRYKEEQIVSILREAESGTLTATVLQAWSSLSTATYRWRRQFTGMEVSDVRELRRYPRGEREALQKLLAERDLEAEVTEAQIQAKKT